MSDEQAVQVADDPGSERYRATVDGAEAGVAVYRRDGEVVTFTHTEVGDEYEGQGVGSDLVRGALDDVRRRGGRVVAQCPFVASYIEKHPEYGDLLAG